MRLPGFTAGDSLFKTRQRYRMTGIVAAPGDAGRVAPQQDATVCVPTRDGASAWCSHCLDWGDCFINPTPDTILACVLQAVYYNARCCQNGAYRCDPMNPDPNCCTEVPWRETGGQGGPGYPWPGGWGRPLPQ
jgi:hypothetical protein